MRSYLQAAHGDDRAACRRIAVRAIGSDLHRLADAYRVPTVSGSDRTPARACRRLSQRIAQAMTLPARYRFGLTPLGTVRLGRGAACVEVRRYGLPVVRRRESWFVDGLKGAALGDRRASRQANWKNAYKGC